MLKKIKQILTLLCLIIVLILPYFVFAEEPNKTVNPLGNVKTVAEGGGYSAYNKDTNSIPAIVGKGITAVLGLLGVIFLVLMVYGGYLWMTDAGNSEQVEKAKKIIAAAVIGLIIVISSYAISYFVINSLQGSVLNTNSNSS